MTVLDRLVHRDLVTKDWMDLAKAVLTPPAYIKWTALFKEECCMQAERNQAAEHQVDITLAFVAMTDMPPGFNKRPCLPPIGIK